jgi:XRE family transcriptional regulator, regulator of sulfur utilization
MLRALPPKLMLTRKEFTLVLLTAISTATIMALAQPAKPPMGSSVFDWNSIPVQTTKTGERRQFFQSPTATLDQLECHVTTLNKGEVAHAPHQHPDEEIIIVKEGTLETLLNGEWKRVGPGSVLFHASNVLHGVRNAGDGPTSYHVLRWISPGMKKVQPAAK